MKNIFQRIPVDFWWLNGLLLLVFIAVAKNLDFGVSESIMFSAADAKEYLSTGYEFYKTNVQGHSHTRPFLYPLILVVLKKSVGLTGIWLFQVFCWLISANLIYFSIRKFVSNRWYAIFGVALFAGNLCLIALTYHALTELISVLLLSWLLHHLVSNREKAASLSFFHMGLGIMVLLTVVKPLFYLPVLGLLFVVLPAFYLKKYLKAPVQFIYLLLICTPLFFQVGIMKLKYYRWTVSEISEITLRNYLFVQVYQNVYHEPDREKVLKQVQSYSNDKVKKGLIEHAGYTLDNFVNNIKGNINSESVYLKYPQPIEHPRMWGFMKHLNRIYLYCHLFFLGVLIFSISRKRFGRHIADYPLIAGYLVFFYIIFTSGISFYQGDRLVMSALPVFCTLYPILFARMMIRERKSNEIA